MDEKMADKILGGLKKRFDEMETDPAQPVRLKAEGMLASLSADLQNDSDTRARVERMKLEVIDNPAVGQWLEGLWDTARAGLLRMVQSFAPVPATGGFADALRGLGHSLETDERLNGAVKDRKSTRLNSSH